MDHVARLIERHVEGDARTEEQRHIALTGVEVRHHLDTATVDLHGPARRVGGRLIRLAATIEMHYPTLAQSHIARHWVLTELTRAALSVGLPDGPYLDTVADGVLSGASGGISIENGPVGDLRVEARGRTLSAIRTRFPRIGDDEVGGLATMLLRSAGRPTVHFWRGSPVETHAAEFSLLRSDEGEAFYVSRIE